MLFYQNCSEVSHSEFGDDGDSLSSIDLEQVILPLGKTQDKRFNIVWLEPQSINPSVVGREGQMSSSDLREILKAYKRIGITQVVVAYSEFLSQIRFK